MTLSPLVALSAPTRLETMLEIGKSAGHPSRPPFFAQVCCAAAADHTHTQTLAQCNVLGQQRRLNSSRVAGFGVCKQALVPPCSALSCRSCTPSVPPCRPCTSRATCGPSISMHVRGSACWNNRRAATCDICLWCCQPSMRTQSNAWAVEPVPSYADAMSVLLRRGDRKRASIAQLVWTREVCPSRRQRCGSAHRRYIVMAGEMRYGCSWWMRWRT